jgi:predicted Holliday junction resolvase-like endonuclease
VFLAGLETSHDSQMILRMVILREERGIERERVEEGESEKRDDSENRLREARGGAVVDHTNPFFVTMS